MTKKEEAVDVMYNISRDNQDDHADSCFPYDMLDGLANDYAELYTSYVEPPLEFFYMSFLTCLGNLLADKITADSEIKPQPRLYTLLLGESADDRKSTAIKKTVSLFKEYINYIEGAGSAEGLQKELKDKPKLLLCYDEFQQFVGKATIQSSVLLPCISTLFENNSYNSPTKYGSVKLENVHLSILSACTKETFEHVWDSSFTNIGFNNRLLIIPAAGKRKYSWAKTIPAEEKRKITTQIGTIIGMTQEPISMKITDEGFKIYDDWYHALETSVYTKRIDTYAMRLMPLLAINEMKLEIDKNIVQKTLMLVNWQLHVRKEYAPIDVDNMMAQMEEKIRRVIRKRKNPTIRELKQYTNAYKYGIWYFKTAIDNLIQEKEIAHNDDKTPKWRILKDDVE